jgi:o-succinylbenzoate synthase
VTESLGQIWVVSIPLVTPFRSITNREALIFRGERFSEWSPFEEYSDLEAATWLKAALSWANDPLPKTYRDKIRVNATLPAVPPRAVGGILERFGNLNTVKIKVAAPGDSLTQDLTRVLEVNRLYPKAKLRLDANGGYTIDQAEHLVSALGGLPVEYLEQPVATVAELTKLRQRIAGSGIKIAADESIRKASDPMEVVRAKAADIVMLKAQPLGGIAASLEIAREAGIEVVVSSALETSLGISHGAYLAAALPELNYDCGLDTVNLLTGDISRDPMIAEDGVLELRVAEANPELLQRYQASEERTKWWLARLQRCLELI